MNGKCCCASYLIAQNLLLCLFHLFPIGFDAVVSFVHFLFLSTELLDYLCCLVFFVAVFQWIDVFVICAVVSNTSTLSLLWSPLLSHLTFILPVLILLSKQKTGLFYLFVAALVLPRYFTSAYFFPVHFRPHFFCVASLPVGYGT